MVTENEIFDELQSYGLTLRRSRLSMAAHITPTYYLVENIGPPHVVVSPWFFKLEDVLEWWNIMKGLFEGD